MLTEFRRALHQIPELDRSLPETAAYLRSTLSGLPCTLLAPWEDAVCAYFDLGKPETIAFRSDMDALPITEQTGLSFASRHTGQMHACGHDGHMAALLGLALYIAGNPSVPTRNVLLIFQPAEETTGGARALCETGLLEHFHVTRIYGLHLWPDLPEGTVASCAGGMMARSCELTAEITGRSVHLARYTEGTDALAAASKLIMQLYALADNKPCLLRFGHMTSGSARNAVSDHSLLEGSLRCFDDRLFAEIWAQAQQIARQLSEETHCRVSLHRSAGYPPMDNDAALLAEARQRFPIAEAAPTYITEDFSEYQRRVPGVFFLLGTGGIALHSPQFNFNESVLNIGLALFRSLL